MKYIIVVDKQPRTNPSSEKQEYEIDIDELRKKGDVHDDLKIENGIAKVYRRIRFTKTHMTYILDKEVVEELGEIKIKLFEGDNYIYVKDEYNNQICVEHIVKSDFTDMYITKLEMSSSIKQTATSILESVSATYATIGSLQDTSKTLTASIELKINKKDLVSELNASADVIRMKAGKFIFDGANFKLDDKGNITATNANISGVISNYSSDTGDLALKIENQWIYFYDWKTPNKKIGTIGTVHSVSDNIPGVNFFCEKDYNLSLGVQNTNDICTAIQIDKKVINGSTPYIRNTADGTIFSSAGGGIVVENGLIKGWNITAANGDLPVLLPGATSIAIIHVKNGLIIGWDFE